MLYTFTCVFNEFVVVFERTDAYLMCSYGILYVFDVCYSFLIYVHWLLMYLFSITYSTHNATGGNHWNWWFVHLAPTS